ncbi:hypothetical protein K501DRAFT_289160 [Backusella circina FSU 941]|nr:hypothetical protein K501DRAFT_289160 [Backusella circina FSU 941]
MVLKKRKAAQSVDPIHDDDPGRDAEYVRIFKSLKTISSSDIDAMFPQASQQSNEYQFPQLPEATIETMRKIKAEWLPGKEVFFKDAQRVSVHVINETIEKYSLSKSQTKRILGDLVVEIDRKLRLLRFPGISDPVFSPDALSDCRKAIKELEHHLGVYTKACDDTLPLLDQTEEAEQRYNELVKELENMEKAINDHPNYSEHIVDPDDYTQSLFLYNSNTLQLFTS